MSGAPKNVAASVRQRLTNKAKSLGIEFQRALVLYGIERLLYRISVSPYADRFVLKGASLFSLWLNELHRKTRDVDLLGTGLDADTDRLALLFEGICTIKVEDDGLLFDATSVRATYIRESNQFGGMRVTVTASLENARITLQVDIGLGDVTIPEPLMTTMTTLLDGFQAPELLAYQRETVIAEKLHAIVVLERSNSRMKDFFDLYVLAKEFSYAMPVLSATVREVFTRRTTDLPISVPDGLTQEFANDANKQNQWKAFLKQNVTPPRNAISLTDVIDTLSGFLLPVLDAAKGATSRELAWITGGPWSDSTTE
ncbi:MAG TPA: nucleotidyl transferase AbiEii/AbiGii toxin family protein [Capsulimonadaceae bacterium]|jgi:predicted nucleotidyltransferase component of viral defense system